MKCTFCSKSKRGYWTYVHVKSQVGMLVCDKCRDYLKYCKWTDSEREWDHDNPCIMCKRPGSFKSNGETRCARCLLLSDMRDGDPGMEYVSLITRDKEDSDNFDMMGLQHLYERMKECGDS